MDKFTLINIPHPKPYKLHWIKDDGGITVKDQVNIQISIGNYQESVLCDTVPMKGRHTLLGRPCQFYKNSIYDGLTNNISFTHKGKKAVFCTLTPKQVRDDQLMF